MSDPSQPIAYCKIHPSIGIARVGNSPEEYHLGPEVPGAFDPPEGGYKDDAARPRVKRQAARFRIFAYDRSDSPLGEISPAEASVTWTVHLANKKAEWDRFEGRRGEDLPLDERRPGAARNADIEDRASLIIDPGPRTISGPDQRATLDGGRFLGIDVPLGDIRTDGDGRLLVLGGFGTSAAADPSLPIVEYANNDRWHDDTSDGPVTATVTFADGTSMEAAPAWVIVGPPDYAPAIPNFVTAYDLARDVAVRRGWLSLPERPSFTRDIYPILARALSLQWIHARALQGHGPTATGPGNFRRDHDQLANNDEASRPARQRVFAALRNPQLVTKVRAGTATPEEQAEAVLQAQDRFMPSVSGDDGGAREGVPGSWLTLTALQYEMMHRWAEGNFEADWDRPSGEVRAGLPLATRRETTVDPHDLDRAALEAASGGSFFPGIEAGWILRNERIYAEPFRLDHGVLAAGDLTKRMAVPWQADFFECQSVWWPWQRPDDVMTVATFERLEEIDRQLAQLDPTGTRHQQLSNERARLWRERAGWARALPQTTPEGDNEMVRKWADLGFVVSHRPDRSPYLLEGEPAFVETETMKYDGLSMAEYFHILVNIEDHPDFSPKARELALGFFAQADYGASPHYARFPYSAEALDQRMDEIYDDFVATMLDPHWLDTGDFGPGLQVGRFSDAAVVENLRQKAPFNLVDGAWLRNILNTGPCSEVQANLFAIWSDEAGNGRTEHNHCNVYETLLRSANIYLPPITSREFIGIDFLPSAFDNPVFQMSVGLFPQEFLPELLGMTLYLEWEATPSLTPTVRLLEGRNIDPLFYRLHVAIDNIAAGHGHLAKQAVKLYLDDVREKGGDAAVQPHWERIWTGYVTWATTGTFGTDLINLLVLFDGKIPDLRKAYADQQMATLIARKAPAARRSHGAARLGGKLLNELFDDPPALMDLLLNDPEGWIDVASPRDSRFLTELLPFTGPMYKVFTPEDQDIVLDWIEAQTPATTPPPTEPDPARDMLDLLERHATEAGREPRHNQFMLPAEDGSTKSVREWFTGPLDQVMAALARSQWIVPGAPAESTFFTDVVGEEGLMAGVLAAEEVAVLQAWVAAGCPQPGGARLAVGAADLGRRLASAEPLPGPFSVRRRTIGFGSVH